MKFYTVRIGHIPGIYTSWSECQKQVSGYSGAVFKSFENMGDALSFLEEKKVARDNLVYCDGGHNRRTGKDAWGSVVDENGNDLIENNRDLLKDFPLREEVLPKGRRWIIVANFNDVKSQQNNGAELMSMVAALRIIVSGKKYKTLASDSDLLVRWWSKGNYKKEKMDLRKIELIEELIHLRKRFELGGGNIVKISGDENLADLGYH